MERDEITEKSSWNLDQTLNLHDEDGYAELNDRETPSNTKKNMWNNTVEKYLDSVEYAFVKGNNTSKKVAKVFNHIPEPTSKKFVVHFTLALFVLVLIIFLSR